MRFAGRGLALSFLFTAAALPALAQSYNVSEFRFPADAASMERIALTRGGTLFGTFEDAASNSWLFTEKPGLGRKFRDLGATSTLLAIEANDSGEYAGTLSLPNLEIFTLIRHKLHTHPSFAQFLQVVGLNDAGDAAWRVLGKMGSRYFGLLQSGSTHKTIGYRVPGALDTMPMGINNAFAVVGYYDIRKDILDEHGFLFLNGTTTEVTGPGGQLATPVAINDAGVIAMSSGGTNYLFDGTSYAPVTVPGATSTTLVGINNAGGAFGTYDGTDGVKRGFVYKNGAYTTLSAPAGKQVAQLTGMDDAGNITGWWWKDSAHKSTYFVANCTGSGC